MIRILIFVHKNILKEILVISQDVRVGFEKLHHFHQQIAEVQRARRGKFALIAFIDFRRLYPAGIIACVSVHEKRFRVQHIVFGAGNCGNVIIYFLFSFLYAHFFQSQCYDFFLFGFVVNYKIFIKFKRGGVMAEYAHRERMESMYPHARGIARHQSFYSFAHFLRGFIGKSYGQNPAGGNPVSYKFRHFAGKRFGFAGSRTGYDKARAAGIIGGFKLFGV